ncbi:MAG: hypothetical protein PVJ92_03190 [Candidatus Dependentiae bacterium]
MKYETTRPVGRRRHTVSFILLILCMGLFVTAMSKGIETGRDVVLVPFEQPVTYTDVSNECGQNEMGLSFSNIGYCALQKAVEKSQHKKRGSSLVTGMEVLADESGSGNPLLKVSFDGKVKVAVNRFPGFNVLIIDAQRPVKQLDQEHLLYSEASLIRS